MSRLSRLVLVSLCLPFASCASTHPSQRASSWSLVASWVDACCCQVPCSCMFGANPSEGHCDGASLLEIDSGHYGVVPLDGLAVVVTYQVGGWTKVTIEESATRAQLAAVADLMPSVLPFLGSEEPVGERGSIEVERGHGTVSYSSPDTVVELELVKSASGAPIQLTNLPVEGAPLPLFRDHVQYKSRKLAHRSAQHGFEYSGRNGFTASLSLSGDIE